MKRLLSCYILFWFSIGLFSQDNQTETKADSLFTLGNECYTQGKYEDAIRFATKGLDIYESLFGKKHLDYASHLNNIALYHCSLGNYEESIRLGLEATNITKNILGSEHIEYAIALNNLAQYNYCIGNYAEAIQLTIESINIIKNTVGFEHHQYAIALNNLALYNYTLGNYTEAIRLVSETLDIYEKTIGREHHQYAIALNNLALYNYTLGNYIEAIRLVSETLDIYEKTIGREHPDYAKSVGNLALYNYSLGNYAEAIRLGAKSINIIESTLGNEHPEYAKALNNLSYYNYSLGNYAEAINLGTEAMNIIESTLGKQHIEYATALNNLSQYNYSVGEYAEAILLGTEAIKTLKNALGMFYRLHPNYAKLLNNLSLYNCSLGNYTEAIHFSIEATNIIKDAFGEEHPDYATSLMVLVGCYLNVGNYNKAYNLCAEAINVLKKTDENNLYYITSLINFSTIALRNKNSQFVEYSINATQLLTNHIKKNFIGLNTIERVSFWNQLRYWYEEAIHCAAYFFPILRTNGYNGILLSKCLLLNSEIELNTLIKESGDKEAEKIYNELRILRLQLNKLYEKPIAERALDTDSLERVAQDLERELVQRSKVYGDFTKNLAISWKQVQQKLGDKDLAVEFVSFPVRNDSVMYAAYCLRKGMEAPKMYPLFEKKQLESLDRTNLYDSTAIGELVWKPLEKELQGVNNVYFAPVGELYNIAIESVPYWKGNKWMSDQWNFYRLSSTRELALTKDEKSVNEAVLYGGLEYDTNVTTMVNNSQKYAVRSHSTDFSLYNLADSLNLRKGVAFLPESKVEAEAINAYMRQTTIRPTLFTDTIGTETSFKALTGKRIKIVHIATHGFYWTESEAKGLNDMLSFLSIDNNRNRYVEDKALMRSGLLFAGANNALVGKQLPKDVDDGILTAQEIANLDLRGLDIVVLSACQTGLGEITGDGVFGLQRGFKKAGANTLLMSLWNVHDDATRLLMTQFYENLIAGKGKAESLREAQQYVRNYEIEKEITQSEGKRPLSALAREQAQKNKNNRIVKKIRPYQSPKYWAAFILLDAIDSSISTPIDEYSN